MSRANALLRYALIAIGLAALFVVFITFRSNSALIAALEAAGTVAAAGFAAFAAMAAMRAAAESSATARRSREALARAMRPWIEPSTHRENGAVLGRLRCEGRTAVDVTATWVLTGGDAVIDRVARLALGSSTDAKLPEGATVTAVWIEFWDDSHAGRWRDTWQPDTEQRLELAHSELVD